MSPATEWGVGASGRLKVSVSNRVSASVLVLVRKDCFCREFWGVGFVGDCGVSRAQKRVHFRRLGLGGAALWERECLPGAGGEQWLGRVRAKVAGRCARLCGEGLTPQSPVSVDPSVQMGAPLPLPPS